jgi:hypothetical protein
MKAALGPRNSPLRILAVAGVLVLPGSGLGMDGVVEINQVKALAGGVTPGDAAGFPVRLGQRGSYRLTGDLAAPLGAAGIELAADDISLDLNGFAVRGPVPCGPGSGCAGASAGIYAAAALGGDGATVANGEVGNFPGACVALREAAHVERLVVHDCGDTGVETGAGSLVLSNRIERVDGPGMRLGGGAFRGNTLFFVAGPMAENGRPIGGNVCGLACTADGRRRFYLTRTDHPADQVLTACAPGFHFASIWEIKIPSDAAYDPMLGRVSHDVITGLPAFLYGWAGSGKSPQAGNVLGANCNGWTTADPTSRGTAYQAGFTNDQESLWGHEVRSCSLPSPVWCAED